PRDVNRETPGLFEVTEKGRRRPEPVMVVLPVDDQYAELGVPLFGPRGRADQTHAATTEKPNQQPAALQKTHDDCLNLIAESANADSPKMPNRSQLPSFRRVAAAHDSFKKNFRAG